MQRSLAYVLGLVLAGPVAAEPPPLTHILGLRWAIEIDNASSQLFDLSWRPELRWQFSDGGRLTAVARARFQPTEGMRPDDVLRSGYTDASRPILIGERSEGELREFYYQRQLGDWHLTLGKQQVVWGKADGLKVLDVVDPQSLREFILEDFDQSRIPLWTINVERPIGDWTMQIVWLVDPSVHALPKDSGTYAFSSPRLVPSAPPGVTVELNEAERPRHALADSDIGVRLTSFLGGWDLSLNYLYQYDDQAALHQRFIPGPTPRVEVTPRYHRSHLLGGAASRAFGDWVVRAELGYFSKQFFLSRTSADGLATSPELSYVLGIDWTGLRDSFFSVQVFQSWLPDHHPDMTRPKWDNTLTALLRREFLNDTLTAEILWIANLHDHDGLVRPKASYTYSDTIKLWAGLDFFYGHQGGLFGQFDRRDRVLLGVELGF